MTENEKLRQNLNFIENNKEFGQRYTDHLKDQINHLNNTIDSQQKTINQLKQFKGFTKFNDKSIDY